MVVNPFGMGNARQGLYKQQSQQQPYDFKGLDERLGKLETGIAGLTDQFKNFQTPAQETVSSGYTGSPTPPTGYSGNDASQPIGGPGLPDLDTIASPGPVLSEGLQTQIGGMAQNTGFNFDPSGGSLMSQLSSAYGGQTHNEQMGRGPAGFTQGFADFFTGEGYYADPRGTFADGPWSISETPITLGSRMGGTLDPYGNRPQTSEGHFQTGNASGSLVSYPPNMPQSSNPEHYATINPNLGAGIGGLQKGYNV